MCANCCCEKNRNYVIMLWLTMCLMLMMVPLLTVESKICEGDIDMRNDPETLLHMRNCSVIAGSVSIVLMERHKHVNFSQYQFPELKEITGYLVMYRVYGLRTLEHLFPNLAVIRGDELILHYAFMLFEMNELGEIGLKSLVKIQRGYVFIGGCPALCYTNTIDWSKLTQSKVTGWGNYLHTNALVSQACPTNTACPSCEYCWSNKHCQLFETGFSHVNKSLKCHSECIGGCVNATSSGCNVCRNFKNEGACVDQCPKDKFLYMSRKECVDGAFCKSRGLIPFQRECRRECPAKYTREDPKTKIVSNTTCYECSSVTCMKRCQPSEIETLATSELLRGCQIILNNLNIRIQSGVADTMKILQRNLGDIEEIHGLLKVYRSPALTSLSFLRSLRLIKGQNLEAEKYSLVLTANENLQKIWDYTEKRGFKLERGNLLIHYNSKLCLNEIHALQSALKTNASEDLISLESNGYEESCSAQMIISTVDVLSSTAVTIIWQRFKIPDSQKIVGYTIYYIEAPEKNITHMGIDSCATYGWQTFFVQNFTIDELNTSYRTNLTNLEQYTQYAYYVKTQVVYKDHENDTLNVVQGQSNVLYFQTEADIPTAPVVETTSKSDTSISIEWYPAVADREFIEYYKVDVFVQPDDHRVLDSRDYCLYPREDRRTNVGVEVASSNVKNCSFKPAPPNWESPSDWAIDQIVECYRERDTNDDRRPELTKLLNVKKHYVCEWNDENCPFEYVESESDSRFTRDIHDFVKKHDIDERNKYEIGIDTMSLDVNRYGIDDNTDDDDLTPEIRSNPNFLFTKRFNETTSNATIDHLKPFTLYTMHFFSCNRIDCSSYYMHNERTEPSANADDMDFELSADSAEPHTVHLDFSEPKTPNGLTVAFIVTIHDVTNMNNTKKCVTRRHHYENNKRFTVSNLQEGKYKFSVSSISLAMNGSPTPFKSINVYNAMSTAAIVAIVILSLVLSIACATIVLYFWRRYSERRRIAALAGSRMNILMSEEIQESSFNVNKMDDDLFDIEEDSF